MFENKAFARAFDIDKKLKITLLISGPIAVGHLDYAEKLLRLFNETLSEIDSNYRKRIFLGFIFSEIDKPSFKEKHIKYQANQQVGLYVYAHLVVLSQWLRSRMYFFSGWGSSVTV